jgi:hypothetical protein
MNSTEHPREDFSSFNVSELDDGGIDWDEGEDQRNTLQRCSQSSSVDKHFYSLSTWLSESSSMSSSIRWAILLFSSERFFFFNDEVLIIEQFHLRLKNDVKDSPTNEQQFSFRLSSEEQSQWRQLLRRRSNIYSTFDSIYSDLTELCFIILTIETQIKSFLQEFQFKR